MRKKLLIFLSVILSITVGTNAQNVQTIGGHTILKSAGKFFELYPADTVEIDTTKLFVRFNRAYEESGIGKITENNFTLKRKSPYGTFVYFIPERINFIESISFLASLAEIDNFELNHMRIGESYILTVPNDQQLYNDFWHLKKTRICLDDPALPYAWQLTTGDKNVIIAVLDDGLKLGPDFDPNLPGYDYYDNDPDYSPNMYHVSHGTQMSTIIGAKTSNQIGLYGIAGGDGQGKQPITIMAQRIASKNYLGNFIWYDETVAEAIVAAVDQGARVINFAFGQLDPPVDSEVDLALDYATLNDITIIAAAGNEGNLTHVSWPASRDDVISVAAMTESEERLTGLHGYGSNMGPENDIVMPGDMIEVGSSPLNYNNSRGSGTSISCAMATGVVSLMLSVNPCLTREEIRNILIESCEKVGTYQYVNGHNWQFGYGMVNAYTAVSLATPHEDILVGTGTTKLINTNQPISGDITVENNAVLTISNCTLSMYPDTKIIVKPGGKLYINNATLTSKCRKPWIGIEVWGNKNQHQFVNANGLYYQGYVKLENATIENSIEALNLWHPNDYNSTGGIVFADKSKFINNRESVHALLYKNTHPVNGSEMYYNAVFTDCEFRIINGFFHEYMEFFKHVDLNQVNGVRFNGCDFSIEPGIAGINPSNQAIASYSSGVQVNAICKTPNQTTCTDYDRCTFTGFKNGIFANDAESKSFLIYINRAIFTNNDIGVNATAIEYPIIINSDFYIAQNGYSNEICSYGIYFNGVTSFSIEENHFYKYPGASPADYIGIGVIESNSISQIYKNTFDGLSAGNYAYGHNWVKDPQTGLEYLCNINTNNYADFFVTGTEALDQGVQSYQGNSTIPAGNRFSDNAAHHFYNGTKYPVVYYYCRTCPKEQPINVTNIGAPATSTANQCLSHYGGSGNTDIILTDQEKLDLELQFALANQNLDNVTELYNQLKDGGSTESEIDGINQASNDEMWAVRTKLLGDSPHLSQEVLMLVADKTDFFPDAVIFDILAANPDELRDAKLMEYLEQKDNPLPDYMIDILKEVSLGTTYKTTLQQEMTRYHYEKVRAAEDIIRSIISEPELDMTQLRNWLDNIGEIEYDKQIISTYIQEGDFSSAIALADLLPSLYNLQGIDLIEHENFTQMLNLQSTLNSQNRSFEELTSEELTLVEDMSVNSVGSAGVQAISVLEAYYDRDFDRCKSLQGETSYKSQSIDLGRLSDAYGFTVSVQPNPASNWITIDYSLPLNETSAELIITSTTGSIVQNLMLQGNIGQKVIDLSNIPSGTYSYNIKSQSFIKSGKIIVVK